MKFKYTREELQEALKDVKQFILMTKDTPNGTPKRLLIFRDLLKKELIIKNHTPHKLEELKHFKEKER